MLKDLILKSRSYRRFYQEEGIDKKTLKDLIDHARLGPSAANRQPIKYIIAGEREKNEKIFSCLSWAGYLKDWDSPEEGEKPPAYIIVLVDKQISENYWDDPGIAMQNMLLAAAEKGLGGCIFGAVDREKLRRLLGIKERFEILYVVALGKPRERVELETVGEDGDIKYWRDDQGIHHVPKRKLSDLIIEI